MALVKSDIPSALTVGVKTVFEQALAAQTPGNWANVAMVVPSTKDSEDYAWLGNVPAVREWLGERKLKGLTEARFELVNKKYETSLEVAREALEDDQYGWIPMRIREMVEAHARHTEKSVFELLAAGFTGLDYKGDTFFSDSHTWGDNKGTTALGLTALEAAIVQMAEFVDDQGEPLGIVPDTLVVPPALQFTARQLVQSAQIPGVANNDINPVQGMLDVVVSPYLTDATDWFLLKAKGGIRPLILQKRTDVEFQALTDDNDAFMRDSFKYGTRERKAVGYGLPQYAFGATVAGS